MLKSIILIAVLLMVDLFVGTGLRSQDQANREGEQMLLSPRHREGFPLRRSRPATWI